MVALKLVIVLITVSAALAKPNASPAIAVAAPAVAVAAPAAVPVAAPVNLVAPANIVAPAVIAAPEPPVKVAHVPAQVGTAISKTVHFAETPVVTGYTSTLYKSDLSAFDTPFQFNLHQRYLRPVKTLVPKLVPLESRAHHVGHVEVPLAAAAVRDIELHPPILPEIRIADPVFYPPVIAPLI